MSKTWKDKPDKYRTSKDKYTKPKEKRFVSSKGRQKQTIKKDILEDV